MASKTIAQSSTVDRRWYFVTLVAGAIAISYFDRQTISVAISTIQRTIPISQQQFSYLSTAFLSPTPPCMPAEAGCWTVLGLGVGFY